MEILDHPDSVLLVAELLLLRLLEEEVVLERLLRVQDGQEEVPQLLAHCGEAASSMRLSSLVSSYLGFLADLIDI